MFAVRTSVIVIMLAVATACDPGMTIHQTAPQLNGTPSKEITMRVRSGHPFIGTKPYAPDIEIMNATDSPIDVVSIELITRRGTFENKSQRSGAFPLEVPPGSTRPLDVLFELADSVKLTFRKPTELQVHYRMGSKDQTARASLIGGKLDTSIP